MALAQLFYLREAVRRQARSLRNRWTQGRRSSGASRTAPRVASAFQVETLEDRVLLSATSLYTAADASSAVDVTLTVQAQNGAETLLVVDNSTAAVLASVDLSTLLGNEPVSIIGSAYDDRITIDASVLNATIAQGIQVDGGGGVDILLGPSQDLTWQIVGPDAGFVGNVTFSNIANLTGAADNEDTFVFEVGGSLSGTIDGGAGGYDTLVMNGGSFDAGTFVFDNSSDGSIDLMGGGLISYVGLEPITSSITLTDVVLTFNSAPSTITLTSAGPGMMTITSGASETLTFANPTNSLTINAGGGNDTVVITSVDAAFNASLIINGDGGNDTINLNADITFAAGKNLDVNLTNDAAAGDADTINVGTNANLELAGTGTATLQASRNILLNSGSSVTTVDGDITLSANQQATSTAGSFAGVQIGSGAVVSATGLGTVTVQGTGGNSSVGNSYGVILGDGSSISANGGAVTVTGKGGSSGTSGSNNTGVFVSSRAGIRNAGTAVGATVTVQGTGGASSGNANYGVYVVGTNAQITATGGALLVEGTGGGTSTSGNNHGVFVQGGGVITNMGTGAGATVTVQGTGTGNVSSGVIVANLGSQIRANGGAVLITGVSGSGPSSSAILIVDGQIMGTASGSTVTLIGDSMDLQSSTSINAGTNNVVLKTRTAGTLINLGGADVLSGSPLTLGLTDAELDGIIAGTLQIGDASSGTITVSAAITHGNHLSLTTGGGITVNQSVTMATDKSLAATTISTTAGISLATTNSDLAASGTGAITLTAARNITLASGSSVTTFDGAITLSANQQATSTAGNFQGVLIQSAAVTALGLGNVTIKGTGGVSGSNLNYGVSIASTNLGITANGGAVVVEGTGGGTGASQLNIGVRVQDSVITNNGTGSEATVTVTGRGGNISGTGGDNYGVIVTRTAGTMRISSSGGAVLVEGTGGGAGTSTANFGVWVHSGSVITNAGTSVGATVTVTGRGGNNSGTSGSVNYGVRVSSSGQITASGGAVLVEGTGGGTGASVNNYGVFVESNGVITNGGTGAGATVTVRGIGGNSTGTSGNTNYGVFVSGAGTQIMANGGAVLVEGTGGGTGTSTNNYGVQIESGGLITNGGTGTGATVTVRGFGGNSTGTGGGSNNYGVYVTGTNSRITAGINAGAVVVEGTGGGAGTSGNNHGIFVQTGGVITNMGTGTVTVMGTGGNSSSTTRGGSNYGVYVVGTGAQITGGLNAGAVLVKGIGGGAGTGSANGGNIGVFVESGGVIMNSGTSSVTVTGTGGNLNSTTGGGANIGVYVTGTNAQITANGGAVLVEGIGGGLGIGSFDYGVYVEARGVITNTGAGPGATVTVKGIGGNSTGTGNFNFGVWVYGANAQITANGGAILITGVSGSGTNSSAIYLALGQIVGTASGSSVTLIGDSMDLQSTTSINAGANTVVLTPRTAGTLINLGGADVLSLSPLTLGLTDEELNSIIAGTISIGDGTSGAVTVSQAIAHSTSSSFVLTSGSDIVFTPGSLATGGGSLTLTPGAAGSVQPITSGTDVTTASASSLLFGSGADLRLAINGPTVDTQYHQLRVSGQVNLTGADLVLTGAYVPATSDSFILVNNDSDDAIIGTFNDLAEGAIISHNVDGVVINKKITYTGGDGNDVALVPVVVPVNLSVSAATGTEAGTTVITVTATADGAVFGNQTIDLAVTGSNITTGDYTLSSNTITILNGETSGSVTFTVLNDTLLEGTETATLTISNPSSGLILDDDTQNVEISDDEHATVAIAASSSVTEGGWGALVGVVTLTITGTGTGTFALGEGISVTADVTDAGGGTATSDTDYSTWGTQGVWFDSGALSGTTASLSLTVIDDVIVESDETINLSLGNLGGSSVAKSLGNTTNITTILNNDTAVLSINNVSITEGDSGSQTMTFTVGVDQAVQGGFTVAFNPTNISTTSGDYSVTSSSPLSFAGTVGETHTINVAINGDTSVEANEQFRITLGAVGGTTPVQVAAITSGAFGTGTIIDNDTATTAGAVTVQYSDSVTLSATISTGVATMVSGTVTFSIDTDLGPGTVWVPYALATVTNQSSPATVTATTSQVLLAPGSYDYRAVFVSSDPAYTGSTGTGRLTVAKEDARATYTGLTYISTSSASSSNATVVLSATIQDITAAMPAGADQNSGDIRNATVTFINRDNNSAIATVPVGLVNANDTKTGMASYSWNVNIGNADSETYTVGIIVNNYYTRNEAADNTVVTVKKPTAGSIGGGGFLINPTTNASTGLYAGEVGAKTNFGLNVKFNKQGTNLQGNVNIIVRSNDGHVYQFKSNAIDSLNITSPSPGVTKATFTSKANVTDITNPLAPISLGGNKLMQITMTDNGEPGSRDTIGLTVYNASVTGGVLFSSSWTGTNTIEQLLSGGNLQVRPALLVEGASQPGGDVTALTTTELQPIVEAAKAAWLETGLTVAQVQALNEVVVQIDQLPDQELGWESAGVITIDADAAGHGWFVDPTPRDNAEFHVVSGLSAGIADGHSLAAGRVDLLTVVTHELGHLLGFDHDARLSVMQDRLDTGVRRWVEGPAGEGEVGATASVGARHDAERSHPMELVAWTDHVPGTEHPIDSLLQSKPNQAWVKSFLFGLGRDDDDDVNHELEVTMPGSRVGGRKVS